MSAFLRKWSASANDSLLAPSTPASASSSTSLGSTSTSPPGSVDPLAPCVPDWPDQLPNERYYGLENFGNTCYANSVLQALYFSKPFRELIESYPPTGSPPDPVIAPPIIPTPSSPTPARPNAPIRQPTFVQMGSSRSASASGSGLAGGNRSFSNSASTSTTNLGSMWSTDAPKAPSPIPTPAHIPALVTDSLPITSSSLLSTLYDLFTTISAQNKSTGSVAPQAFIGQLRRDNEFFRSTLHQDAHEFLNYLINVIAEQVEQRDLEEEREERLELEKDEEVAKGGKRLSNSDSRMSERARSSSRRRRRTLMRGKAGRPQTLIDLIAASAKDESVTTTTKPKSDRHPTSGVHELFEGILTNETRCLTCETVTSRDEAFLDLSIDIEPNSSVTSCLKQFSASEMLCQRNKFSCDQCCGLQEAEKRMKIKKLPNILALHLKRFKYEESLQRHVKLTYRVVFPFELRLFNTAADVSDPDRLYELWAIIVHIGIGPHHGHYITIVKSGKRWVVFDDNTVVPIEESEIQKYYGDTPGQGSGYVLFYQAVDLIDHQSATMAANGDFESGADNTTTAMNGLGLQFNPRNLDSSDSVLSPSPDSAPVASSCPIPSPQINHGEPPRMIFSPSFASQSAPASTSVATPPSLIPPPVPESTTLPNGRRLSVGGGTPGGWGLKKSGSGQGGISSLLGRKVSINSHSGSSTSNGSPPSSQSHKSSRPIPKEEDQTATKPTSLSISTTADVLNPARPLVLNEEDSLSVSPIAISTPVTPIAVSPSPPSAHFPPAPESENGSVSSSNTNRAHHLLAPGPISASSGGASLGSRTMSFLSGGRTDKEKAMRKAEEKETKEREKALKEEEKRRKKEKKKLG